MDLEKEMEKLKSYEGVNWFKAEPGTYKIVFLGEPEADKYTAEDGKVTHQMIFNIGFKEESYKWSVPIGKSLTSLWGQLVKTAINLNNKQFNGLVATVIVNGVGKSKRYTVLEASEVQ